MCDSQNDSLSQGALFSREDDFGVVAAFLTQKCGKVVPELYETFES